MEKKKERISEGWDGVGLPRISAKGGKGGVNRR